MIRGTFAGRVADEGESWWQKGSAAWKGLSARARIKAGADLLEQMLEFETAGRGFHLIGHSHGGSVIWHALCQAVLRRKTLARLRSWTTVGTPFLHYRTSGVWSLGNIGSLVLALLRAPLLTLLEWVGVPVANQSARDIAPKLRDLLNFSEPVRVLTGGQAGNGASDVERLQAT